MVRYFEESEFFSISMRVLHVHKSIQAKIFKDVELIVVCCMYFGKMIHIVTRPNFGDDRGW
jgi:hypothetical protein